MNKFISPHLKAASFNCPHCHALAQQSWWNTFVKRARDGSITYIDENKLENLHKQKADGEEIYDEVFIAVEKAIDGEIFRFETEKYPDNSLMNVFISECLSCKKITLWHRDKILYPEELSMDEPNQDMPDDIRNGYNEARTVLKHSPKAAAALLRLCIQKLCIHLGQKDSDTLNNQIGNLVKQGLDKKIQKALDVVRVIGNEAVHPGTINLNDNKNIAHILFKLVNQIVEQLITNIRELDEIYDMIPAGAKKGIDKRDSK